MITQPTESLFVDQTPMQKRTRILELIFFLLSLADFEEAEECDAAEDGEEVVGDVAHGETQLAGRLHAVVVVAAVVVPLLVLLAAAVPAQQIRQVEVPRQANSSLA